MPTVPAPINETERVPARSPYNSPMVRAMLDNGYSYESVTEWLAVASSSNRVRSEAWWLGQE